MFETIIKNVRDSFGLGDEAGGLVSALLGIIANPANGGFGGFIERFREAGLGDAVDSWIGAGSNQPITDGEVETAFGEETIDEIADQTGIERGQTVSALGIVTPQIVHMLTPEGKVPADGELVDRIKGFLAAFGGPAGAAVLGGLTAAGAFDGVTTDPAGVAVDSTVAADDEDQNSDDPANGANGAGTEVTGAIDDVVDNEGSILRWLLPLILIVGLVIIAVWFSGQPTSPAANGAKPNTNKNDGP